MYKMPRYLSVKSISHMKKKIVTANFWVMSWEVKKRYYLNNKNIILSGAIHESSANLLCWSDGFLIVAMASGVGMASPGGSCKIMFSCAAGGSFDPLILAFVMLYSPESKYLFCKKLMKQWIFNPQQVLQCKD